MRLIFMLRKDVLDAINGFVSKHYTNAQNITLKRQQDINNIKIFLRQNDPLKIRNDILKYFQDTTNIIFLLLPFLEFAQFKNCICKVFEQLQYQEIEMLKTLLKECTSLTHDNDTDKNISQRLIQLEQRLTLQDKKTAKLQCEIERLSNENNFLCETIKLLSEKNIELKQQRDLSTDKLKICSQENNDMKQQYAILLLENKQLKEQIKYLNKIKQVNVVQASNCDNKQIFSKGLKQTFKISDHPSVMRELSDNHKLKRRHSLF